MSGIGASRVRWAGRALGVVLARPVDPVGHASSAHAPAVPIAKGEGRPVRCTEGPTLMPEFNLSSGMNTRKAAREEFPVTYFGLADGWLDRVGLLSGMRGRRK